MHWWRHDSAVRPLSRSRPLRSHGAFLRATKRSFSAGRVRCAQHRDDEDYRRPPGWSDEEWGRVLQFRRWKAQVQRDPYRALFGASNEMLKGRGLVHWLNTSLPAWVDELEKQVAEKAKAAESKTKQTERAQETRGSGVRPKPGLEREYNDAVASPSDPRWPRRVRIVEEAPVKKGGMEPGNSLRNVRKAQEAKYEDLTKRNPRRPREKSDPNTATATTNHFNPAQTHNQTPSPSSENKTPASTQAAEGTERVARCQTALDRLAAAQRGTPKDSQASAFSSSAASKPKIETQDKPVLLNTNSVPVDETPSKTPSHRPAILNQLPEDDLDFLTADDIRASMGKMRTTAPTIAEKQKARDSLEYGFKAAHNSYAGLHPMIQAKIVNDQHIRRIKRELKAVSEMQRDVASRKDSVVEAGTAAGKLPRADPGSRVMNGSETIKPWNPEDWAKLVVGRDDKTAQFIKLQTTLDRRAGTPSSQDKRSEEVVPHTGEEVSQPVADMPSSHESIKKPLEDLEKSEQSQKTTIGVTSGKKTPDPAVKTGEEKDNTPETLDGRKSATPPAETKITAEIAPGDPDMTKAEGALQPPSPARSSEVSPSESLSPLPNANRTSLPITNAKPTEPPMQVFKILTYDPTTSEMRLTTSSSAITGTEEFEPEPAIPLHEALAMLENPNKFIPFLTQTSEGVLGPGKWNIADSGPNMLVLREISASSPSVIVQQHRILTSEILSSAKATSMSQKEKDTEQENDTESETSTSTSEPPAQHAKPSPPHHSRLSPRMINPIDGTTRLSPTGFVGIDAATESESDAQDEPAASEKRKYYDAWREENQAREHAREERYREREEQKRQNVREKEERRQRDTAEKREREWGRGRTVSGMGVAKTAIVAGATCYVAGVVGELVR